MHLSLDSTLSRPDSLSGGKMGVVTLRRESELNFWAFLAGQEIFVTGFSSTRTSFSRLESQLVTIDLSMIFGSVHFPE